MEKEAKSCARAGAILPVHPRACTARKEAGCSACASTGAACRDKQRRCLTRARSKHMATEDRRL